MEPKIEYLKEEELLAVFEYCLKVLNEDRKEITEVAEGSLVSSTQSFTGLVG